MVFDFYFDGVTVKTGNLKFIMYFPDYLSALSRSLLRFFWTTFVETAVFLETWKDLPQNCVTQSVG